MLNATGITFFENEDETVDISVESKVIDFDEVFVASGTASLDDADELLEYLQCLIDDMIDQKHEEEKDDLHNWSVYDLIEEVEYLRSYADIADSMYDKMDRLYQDKLIEKEEYIKSLEEELDMQELLIEELESKLNNGSQTEYSTEGIIKYLNKLCEELYACL